MKKIALLNSVYKGGKTLLNYLTPITKILQELNYDFEFFQPEKNYCDLSLKETANIIDHKVKLLPTNFKTGKLDFSVISEFDIIFSNNAEASLYLNDNKNFVVLTTHGTSAIFIPNELAFGIFIGRSDLILVYGKTRMHQQIQSMSSVRKSFNSLQDSYRNFQRTTFLANLQPIKIPTFNADNFKKVNAENFTIGFLPSSETFLQNNFSLLTVLNDLLNNILNSFPSTSIIFRPYFNDKSWKNYEQNLKNLTKQIPNFSIDLSGQNSNDFYQQCDVLITDGSTGGVSFLLNKAMPPIYYIPRNVVNTNEIVKNFVNIQKDKVLFAYSIKELIKQINYCINLSKEQRINYFNNYCEKDLFLNVDNKQIIKNIIDGNLNDFPYVDEKGNIFNI